MKLASILLLLFSLNAIAQRVEFKDPDLTFSFVKPVDWKVQDDLVVKVVPNNQSFENATTFFSITYFEAPEQTEESDILLQTEETSPAIPNDLKEFNPSDIGRIYIANESALWASYYHTQNGVRVKAISYMFMKMGQRFEIKVSAPKSEFEKFETLFNSILSSISVDKN